VEAKKGSHVGGKRLKSQTEKETSSLLPLEIQKGHAKNKKNSPSGGMGWTVLVLWGWVISPDKEDL